MKRVFAVMLAAACVVGSTPSFARGGFGHGGGFRGGFVRNPTTSTGRRRGAHMEGSCSAPCVVGVVRDHRANSRECRCFLAAAR
jgi:hypothetical protein